MTLGVDTFSDLCLFFACCNKEVLESSDFEEIYSTVSKQHSKYLQVLGYLYEGTIPGFESRKEIGLLLFGGQQVSSFPLLMILPKLSNCQPPGPLYPTQRRPLAESTSQTATHLDKLGTALQGCFLFFQGTRQFS